MSSVQVLIPCYNYGRYLPGAVNSALSQQGVTVKVTIIDDASTDDSASVATRLAQLDSRIEVLRHATNKGHIATYNDGLARVTADYMVLLSADDLLTPGALQRATNLMDAHPNVGLVYGHPVVFRDDQPLPPARSGGYSQTIWNGHDWLEQMCRAGRNFIYCPEVVMRSSVQRRIGGYDPALPHSGDMEMWMRAAVATDIGRINGADQAYYRLHGASMQRTVYSSALFDLRARVAAFDAVLSAPSPIDAARLRRLAHRSVALLALRDALRNLRCGTQMDRQLDVDDYCAFACELDPGIVATPEWRALQRLRANGPSPFAARTARLAESVRSRLTYRYWRRRGLEWPVTRATSTSI